MCAIVLLQSQAEISNSVFVDLLGSFRFGLEGDGDLLLCLGGAVVAGRAEENPVVPVLQQRRAARWSPGPCLAGRGWLEHALQLANAMITSSRSVVKPCFGGWPHPGPFAKWWELQQREDLSLSA